MLSDKRVKIVGIDGCAYTKDETAISIDPKELETTFKLDTAEDVWILGMDGVKSALMKIQNMISDNEIHYIINACDNSKNGDYLFDYVYNQINLSAPVKRMDVKDLCDKMQIRKEYERCYNELLNENIYLKIYVENGDTLVLEGKGAEDIVPFYYPARWDDVAHRIGTVVIGCNHISITHEAIRAFTDIVNKAKHTGDDISCIDVHSCYVRKIDGSISEDCDDVCVSYMGDIIMKLNIEKAIKDPDFFIGCGEGAPRTWLLDRLVLV
jgi:hypothetical protein